MNPTPALGAALTAFQNEAAFSTVWTGRYRCRFSIWGQGEPLIFIPGMNDRARSFVPLMWHLSKHYTCIAYELPQGDGDGARVRGYRFGDYVTDLSSLLDHLDRERVVVFGSSFGSRIALLAMFQLRKRITAGILQGGFARRPLARMERALALFARYFPGKMRQLPYRVRQAEQLDYPTFRNTPKELWDFFLENTGMNPCSAVARRALMLADPDLRPILHQISQPVLMIGSDADPLVPLAYETEVLRGLPAATRVEIVGTGHFPQYVQPELTAHSCRDFLSQMAGLKPACRSSPSRLIPALA